VGRFPIIDVRPFCEGGKFPAKVVVSEVFPVTAKVFREGHDRVSATVVLEDPAGEVYDHFQMQQVGYADDNNWRSLVQVGEETGLWHFYIEAWSDPFSTWVHNASIKVRENQDTELVLEEGALIFEKWSKVKNVPTALRTLLKNTVGVLRDKSCPAEQRLHSATSPKVYDIATAHPLRELVSPSSKYPLQVDRKLASFSAWYQFFPRSEGAKKKRDGSWTSGTFTTAAKRLPAVKDMGFDIIYVPPIHPIGETFRKGPNNTLQAGQGDPGSPWAVGSSLGGHDAVHPDLGTVNTF
jgi:starch synthase (maltosyl-transferring)